MEAIFIKLIEQLNSSVIILLLILVAAFWGMYKLGGVVKLFTFFDDKHKALDTNISLMKDSLAAIKATTDLLYQAHLSTIKAHSPLSLSDRGKEISITLKIEGKIADHWSLIKEKIDKKSPTNPYDIQIIAMDLAVDCFDLIFSEAERNEIKLYAYKSGMNLLEIIPIIGILVRDRYLKENNIDAGEIDKYTPAK